MDEILVKYHRDDGGWGVPPQAPNFKVTAANRSAVLSWSVPETTEVDGKVICIAEGIVIRRSTAGYPLNENSGELVVDSTDLEGTYTDEDLTNGTTYYYRAFPYSDHNVFNREKYKSKGAATPTEAAMVYVNFTADDAIGEEVELTNGTVTKTAKINSSGTAYFEVYDIGEYRIGGQTVDITALATSYVLDEKLYGYDWTLPPTEADTEAQITYPSGVDNANFTPVPARGSDAVIDLGDWQDFHENFLKARPVMLNFDGTVAYELDHNDQTKKLDGTASDISNTSLNMNAMVEYPKRYMKRWTDANGKAHFRLSRIKLGDQYKCYPWLYGATEETALENDVIYMPMFEGASVGSKVRSNAGLTPMNSQAGATEWSQIQALGSGWQFDDFSDACYIGDLMFMMARSTDVQKHWGMGHYTGGSQASHLHATGSLKSYGPYYGGTGNTNHKFCWMENWYGDRWERTFGVWYINSILYVKDFPPYTTDGGVTNYKNLGRGIGGTSGGYISAVTYDEHGMIPQTASGADGKYVPDGAWFANGTQFLLRGADCGGGARVGLAFSVADPFSSSEWYFGPSPAYKKPLAA